MNKRRDFIRQGIFGASALPLLIPDFSRKYTLDAVLKKRSQSEDDFWKQVRMQFPLKEGQTYFNNGTMGPSPGYVLNKVMNHMHYYSVHGAEIDYKDGSGPALLSGYFQYEEIRKKYGYFYPGRAGVDVKGVSVEEWQAYKKAVVKALQTKMYKKGDSISIDGQKKKITKVNTIDGLKIIMEDDSWILLRPSGTEPKFRYYYEVVADKPLENPKKQLDSYSVTASQILERARALVA